MIILLSKALYIGAKVISNTPLHPYWLDNKNYKKGRKKMYSYFNGKVLETGAGNCDLKNEILLKAKNVKKYIATDYKSWDGLFNKQKKEIEFLGPITRGLYATSVKKDLKLDKICDAMNLPFNNNTFNTYCSFATLEHISHPLKFFKEANRVLKKGGYCITSQPFMYREHGGVKFDFQRFTRGGYMQLAKDTGFSVTKIYTESYWGTTLAVLINQFIVRKIIESSLVVKLILLPFAPFIFFLSNSIGYLADIASPDDRFALRYFVIMKKI